MIDPHVHLRDWNHSEKETVKHGIDIAYKAGLDAIFEMPNTDPPLTSRKAIMERLEFADKEIKELGLTGKFFHGLYAGITKDPEQVKEIVATYNELFPRVVGIKMFAGHSTGNMGIIHEDEQEKTYKTLASLGYKGVLAVHCEHEASLCPKLWHPDAPITHSHARPEIAEEVSVKDQIHFAKMADFKGTLHVCHVSTVGALKEIYKEHEIKITCGVTPHHCMLDHSHVSSGNGILLKMNPPLRHKDTAEQLQKYLKKGIITWIETDHAPHTKKDKVHHHASGIPGIPYYPHFIKWLVEEGVSKELIDALTHDNIVKEFGIDIKNTHREPNYDLADEYEFDAFEKIR